MKPAGRLLLVDCARALAAFGVLLWHYHVFFWHPGAFGDPPTVALPLHRPLALFYDYGLWAVPIFWVISGFVFSRVYIGQVVSTGDFIANRFARLYPLHLLTLLIAAALQVGIYARFGTWFAYDHNDASHFALQLTFASNWLNHDLSFNGPIWSVSVEVLIYAVFWAIHSRLARSAPLLPLLTTLAFCELALVSGGNWLAQCGFCFFLGVTLEVASPKVARLFAIALLAMGAALLWRARLHFGVPALFGAILVGLIELERFIPDQWARTLTAIGDNTYGMYLWHMPLVILMFLIFGTGLAGAATSPWFLLAFLTTVILIARVSFLWFEKPMRNRIRRLWTQRYQIGLKARPAA